MLPKVHPFEKTATECRRALIRLENFKQVNGGSEKIDQIIEDLKNILAHIPEEFKK
jgi:hypothetical protein